MSNEKVTLADIYAVVNRLEDKFDKRVSDLEERIGDLENFKSRILGIWSVAVLFVTLAVNYLWDRLVKNGH